MKIIKLTFLSLGLILLIGFMMNIDKINLKNIDNNVELLTTQQYKHVNYNAHNLKDPFEISNYNNSLVVKYAKSLSKTNQIPKKPDLTRNKEYLENFSLNDLTLIGTIKQGGETWALISDHFNIIHKVKKGNYLGKNFGQIQQITEDRILLQELVLNERGDWIDKQTNLIINKNKNYKE